MQTLMMSVGLSAFSYLLLMTSLIDDLRLNTLSSRSIIIGLCTIMLGCLTMMVGVSTEVDYTKIISAFGG